MSVSFLFSSTWFEGDDETKGVIKYAQRVEDRKELDMRRGEKERGQDGESGREERNEREGTAIYDDNKGAGVSR